jgi:hypothetical protein
MDRYSMMVALTGQLCGTLLLVSVIVAWTIRRRAPAIASNDGVQRIESRLSEMQQSLDAVAIEVERISEAQRFATKLLSERGVGAPEVNGVRDAAPRGAAR